MDSVRSTLSALLCTLSCGLLLSAPTLAQAEPRDQDQFFGLERIWDIHLTVAPEVWDALYPQEGVRMGLSQRGLFEYGKADVRIGGHDVANIGVRFKGNSTYWSTGGTLKRSFKLDFNRFESGQEFLGLTKLNLQNNATDTTQLREAVSYQAYRDAGIPAARTCFAQVFLTVPGRLEAEYLGLYTVVEQVDQRFLARNFGSRKGFLAKPEGPLLPDHGPVWNDAYAEALIPKSPVEDAQVAPLIELAQLLHAKPTDGAPDATDAFANRLPELLDVDGFLRYVAVSTILVNLDTPLTIPHNYYLAVPADSGRVVFVPWDLNLSLGGLTMFGRWADLSVMEPSALPMLQKVLAIPEHREAYRQHVQAFIDGCCSSATLIRNLDRAQATVEAALAAEADRSRAVTHAKPDPGGGPRIVGRTGGLFRSPDLERTKDFLEDREDSVRAQLAGTERGRTMRGMYPGSRGTRRRGR